MTNRYAQISRRTLLAGTAAATTFSAFIGNRRLAAIESPDESTDDIEIWDAHGHFTGLAGTPEQRIDQILVYADRMRVQKMMICMGLRFNYDPVPEDFRKDNDDVLRAVEHGKGRILGFVYLNPKHVDASLRELERCVEKGPMVGVKLWIAMRCNHENTDPIVRRAAQLGVPVLQHVYRRTLENKDGESSPTDLAELANRHPKATFIAAHTGNDWEKGIRSLRSNKNVFCEICGSDPTAGMVEMAVRELGAERVVYGSDITGRSFASQIAKVKGANISQRDKRLVLGGNLKKILLPVLTAKGLAS